MKKSLAADLGATAGLSSSVSAGHSARPAQSSVSARQPTAAPAESLEPRDGATAEADMNTVAAGLPSTPPTGPEAMPSGHEGFNTEAYDRIHENSFQLAREKPLSTFSIDVDTASYSNMRRFINQGHLPPKDSVRIEELVNYFTYDYSPPSDDVPFSANVEVATCPWHADHKLAQAGKGSDPNGYRAEFIQLIKTAKALSGN